MTTMARWKRQPTYVQEWVLDKYRDWNVADGYSWYDSVFECFIEDMAKRGIEVNGRKIYFSGFWSQGDGASFAGHINSWSTFIEAHELAKHYPKFCEAYKIYDDGSATLDLDVSFSTSCGGMYHHSHTMSGSWNFDVDNNANPDDHLVWAATQLYVDETLTEVDDLEGHLLDIFRGHADKLYRDLEEEYDFLTSDEQVVEALHANNQLDEAINEYYEAHDDEDESPEETSADVLPPGCPAQHCAA